MSLASVNVSKASLIPTKGLSDGVQDFAEKPKGQALKAMQVDTTALGLDAERQAVTHWTAVLISISCIATAAPVNGTQPLYHDTPALRGLQHSIAPEQLF